MHRGHGLRPHATPKHAPKKPASHICDGRCTRNRDARPDGRDNPAQSIRAFALFRLQNDHDTPGRMPPSCGAADPSRDHCLAVGKRVPCGHALRAATAVVSGRPHRAGATAAAASHPQPTVVRLQRGRWRAEVLRRNPISEPAARPAASAASAEVAGRAGARLFPVTPRRRAEHAERAGQAGAIVGIVEKRLCRHRKPRGRGHQASGAVPRMRPPRPPPKPVRPLRRPHKAAHAGRTPVGRLQQQHAGRRHNIAHARRAHLTPRPRRPPPPTAQAGPTLPWPPDTGGVPAQLRRPRPPLSASTCQASMLT